MMDAELPTDAMIAEAANIIAKASRIAVLTGAGVSAESGVPTFRAADGLWEGHAIEDVASPAGFERDPELVWQFYNGRRANVATVRPNPGHLALAELERRFGPRFTIVTQNVDGLHQVAGNENVVEVHGSLRRTRCCGCGRIEDRGLEPLGDRPICAHCEDYLRPDIVWFGEALSPPVWDQALRAVEKCDVFLVVGTSAVVYPAAGLIQLAGTGRPDGPAKVIEFNLTRTDASEVAHLGLYGPSGETLPRVVAKLPAE